MTVLELLQSFEKSELTKEQIEAAIQSVADSENAMNQRIAELEAERNSLKTELEGTNADSKRMLDELAKTKELNYTLARQLDVSRELKTSEDMLHELFGRK